MSIQTSNVLQKKYAEKAVVRDEALMEAICARTFTTFEGAKAWVAAFSEPVGSENHTKALQDYNASVSLAVDLVMGRKNAVWEKHKMVTSTVGMVSPIQVAQYINAYDELLIDNEWMAAYRMDDLTGGFLGSILNIKQSFRFEQVREITDPAPMGPFAKSVWSLISPEYYKGGMKISDDILEKDPLTSLNLIFSVARYAMLTMKTDNAYLNMNGAATLANTAGYVTAFTTSAQKTITKARLALLKRLKNRGYSMSRNQLIHLYASLDLEGDIETIFGNFSPNTNAVATNYRAIGNYIRHYSMNLLPDLGLSAGDTGILVVAGFGNALGQFQSPRFAQDKDILTSTTRVVVGEGYVFTGDEIQFQLFKLS